MDINIFLAIVPCHVHTRHAIHLTSLCSRLTSSDVRLGKVRFRSALYETRCLLAFTRDAFKWPHYSRF